MNIIFPILLILGHLIFDWEIVIILTRRVENECEQSSHLNDYIKFAISLVLFLSGLYIFHRQKMISPELPVKIYTFYTIARIAVVFVCTMMPPVIAITEEIIESVKCKQNCFKFIPTAHLELLEASCIFVFVEGIFSIPWILQHIGLF